MKALLEALVKGKGAMPSKDGETSEPEPAGDYKAVMKEAAADGDWDAFVDALCSYVGK